MSIAEILVAAAIAAGLIATLFGMANPLQGMFDGQLELAEIHQRLRTGVQAIERDLRSASAPVMPYRVGLRRPDPASGIYYRADTLTVITRPWGDEDVRVDAYYVKRATAASPSHLMHYDGLETDAPVVDHVVALGFDYFAADGSWIDPATLQDGPWSAGDDVTGPFDADLLLIRRIAVSLRVESARSALRGPAGVLFTNGGTATSMERYLPDRVIRLDVTPRNLRDE